MKKVTTFKSKPRPINKKENERIRNREGYVDRFKRNRF